MSTNDAQWQHPKELLKLQKLKFKKRALQERIKGNSSHREANNSPTSKREAFENIFHGKKRKNPFALEENQAKKSKSEQKDNEEFLSESVDQTLFKLLNPTSPNNPNNSITSFKNILTKTEPPTQTNPTIGTAWYPIDWTLKRKLRLISLKPFPWSQKLKISEEASGITSFTRCLDTDQSLDNSPNAKFHQCSLYWQQPFLPWLSLFPRNTLKSSPFNLSTNAAIKSSLYETWTDSFKSLYQLIRTRQCPYFYVCANSFTALFRAAGIFGYTDLHVMVTPTTRGFRHLLKEEDIEFEMPLKSGGEGGAVEEEDVMQTDRDDNEDWLKNMGINEDDIKNINYAQARVEQKTQCQIDSSHESLIQIKGVEVNSFFNFLINCKSAIAPTGPLAGVPPTLLAPVSFYGATLNRLKVRENKIHTEGTDYYSLDLTGPILPSTVRNIFNINHSEHSVTVTFSDIESTCGFSKVPNRNEQKGTTIFGKENLSDCGLSSSVLRDCCSGERQMVSNIECLKYSGESGTYTWT